MDIGGAVGGIVGFLFAFLLIAGIAGGIFLAVEEPDYRKWGVTLTVISTAILIFISFIVTVPAGNVGVVTTFGKVATDTLAPGIHIVVPIANQVTEIDTRVQPHNFQQITAATQENLTVSVTGTMNYHIDGQYASDLFQTVGQDFASKIIDPAFSDYIKQVTPSYSADSSSPNFILNKRDEIRALTKQQLGLNLARYHIIVDDIYIVDISYPQAYEDSITQKQVAQQQVQTEQQVLQQKQIQAQQTVATAQGAADAQVVQAKAQAEANDLISKSLNPELIEFQLVNKLAPGVQTIILPAGQNFILDPKSLGAGNPSSAANPAPSVHP